MALPNINNWLSKKEEKPQESPMMEIIRKYAVIKNPTDKQTRNYKFSASRFLSKHISELATWKDSTNTSASDRIYPKLQKKAEVFKKLVLTNDEIDAFNRLELDSYNYFVVVKQSDLDDASRVEVEKQAMFERLKGNAVLLQEEIVEADGFLAYIDQREGQCKDFIELIQKESFTPEEKEGLTLAMFFSLFVKANINKIESGDADLFLDDVEKLFGPEMRSSLESAINGSNLSSNRPVLAKEGAAAIEKLKKPDNNIDFETIFEGLETDIKRLDGMVDIKEFNLTSSMDSGLKNIVTKKIEQKQELFARDPLAGLDYESLSPEEKEAYVFGLSIYEYGPALSTLGNADAIKLKLESIFEPSFGLLFNYTGAAGTLAAGAIKNREYVDLGALALKKIRETLPPPDSDAETKKLLLTLIPQDYYNSLTSDEQAQILAAYKDATSNIPKKQDFEDIVSDGFGEINNEIRGNYSLEDVKKIVTWFILRQRVESPGHYDVEKTTNIVSGMLAIEGFEMRKKEGISFDINKFGGVLGQWVKDNWGSLFLKDSIFDSWLKGVTADSCPPAFNAMSLDNLAAVGKAYRDNAGGGDGREPEKPPKPPEKTFDFDADIKPFLESQFQFIGREFKLNDTQISTIIGVGFPGVNRSHSEIRQAVEDNKFTKEQAQGLFFTESISALIYLVNRDKLGPFLRLSLSNPEFIDFKTSIEELLNIQSMLIVESPGNKLKFPVLTDQKKTTMGMDAAEKIRKGEWPVKDTGGII
jgi:hypothetical protein